MKEATALLGRREGTVSSDISRAGAKLREALVQEDGAQSS